MNDTNLLGARLPNGLRLYFHNSVARDTVWDLWAADKQAGLTIADFGPVPVLTTCPDRKIIMDGDVVKEDCLSPDALLF